MTDWMTDVWCVIGFATWLGAVCWVIWGCFGSDDQSHRPVYDVDIEDDAEESISPGLCCRLYLSPVQRRVITRWIDGDPTASMSLRSFLSQMQRTKPHHSVPVYWGQVRPLLELLGEHNLISVARQLQERLM